MPKVSIIIPTFNRLDFLPETIASIKRQTFTDWECLVIDDGSTDQTPAFMARIMEEDGRFQYHHRPSDRKKGANACRNFGFEISKGDYIKWFDSDDLMHEQLLEKQVEALESDRNLDFVACLGYYFTESLDHLEPFDSNIERQEGKDIYNYIARGLYFLTPAPLWKNGFLKDRKLFDETLMRGQETDFHFRMLTHGPRYVYSADRLYFIRRGNTDSVSTNAPRNRLAQLSVIRVFDRINDYVLGMPQGKMRNELLNFLAFKQLYNIFKLKVHHGSSPIGLYKETFRVFSKVLKHSDIGLLKKVKAVLGYALLSVGKGYGLLYLPEFDLSKDKTHP